MARIGDPTKRQEKGWAKWVDSRPPAVRTIAERFNPWTLYRMKSTGQRVTVASFYEDGTISVNITGQFNQIAFDRNVFGIDPDDLMECDLPAADETVGTMLSGQEVEENVDAIRVAVRPDLWVMGKDGVAVRKS